MRLCEIYEQLERPLWPTLYEMEQRGITIDLRALSEARITATVQKDTTLATLNHYGITNPNSTAQVRKVLYKDLGLRAPFQTDNEDNPQDSTASDAIALLLIQDLTPGQRECVQALDDYREVDKLLGTYILPMPERLDSDNRIHTEYRQTLETGRLASGNAKAGKPNLQNIPSRSEIGKSVRRAFVATPGMVLVKADYSQLELRIMAALSQDKKLLNAYASPTPIDLHSATSIEMFGDAAPDHRRIAKTYNFGAGYGAGGRRLSLMVLKETGIFIPIPEASAGVFKWWESLSGYRDWREREWVKIVRRGYTETYFGRRNYIPSLDPEDWSAVQKSKREALNMPVQGTGADVVKMWMIEVAPKLELMGARMLLQVHDELLVECRPEDADIVAGILKSSGERLLEGVPLIIDVKMGENWQDGH